VADKSCQGELSKVVADTLHVFLLSVEGQAPHSGPEARWGLAITLREGDRALLYWDNLVLVGVICHDTLGVWLSCVVQRARLPRVVV